MATKTAAWRFAMLALNAWQGAWRRSDGRRHADGATRPAIRAPRRAARGGRHGIFAVAPCVSLDVALALCVFFLKLIYMALCHGPL